MQIADLIVSMPPLLVQKSASRYVMLPKQSQPSANELARAPIPYSPVSKACFL
jgi:hypothetical protein